MYQHTGLSQPGYGLLRLGMACRGLQEAGPLRPQELCGCAGSEAASKACASRIQEVATGQSTRREAPLFHLLNRLFPNMVPHVEVQKPKGAEPPCLLLCSEAATLVDSHPPCREFFVYTSIACRFL